MRVLVVMSSLYTGGAEFSTLKLYGWLRSRGHQVHVVCVKKALPAYAEDRFGLEAVSYLPVGSWWNRLRALRIMIQQVKPDLVHSVLFEANLLGRMARMTLGSFIHVESLVNEMYSPRRLSDPQITRFKLFGYRWLDKITQWKGVDAYHANGHTVAEHYIQFIGMKTSSITVVPRGREVNPFVGDAKNRQKVRKELQAEGRTLILQVGRHEFQKGTDILLQSLASFGRLREVRVVVVGREGKLTPLLKAKIEQYKLSAVVSLIGHREDVNSLLAASDVFVFPSRFEGLPGALIEAEAAGLPVVCSDIPSNMEVVVDGRNAVVFENENAQSLHDTLDGLLSNPAKMDQMGFESLRIFQERFSLESIHMRMEKWLVSCLRK